VSIFSVSICAIGMEPWLSQRRVATKLRDTRRPEPAEIMEMQKIQLIVRAGVRLVLRRRQDCGSG